MSGENPRDLIKRARASVEMGRPEVGLPIAARAAAMAPNDAWALTNLAWLEYLTKRYDEAIRTTGQAIAANPEYEWAHRLRGHTLWRTGRQEAAAAALAEAVRIRPDEATTLWAFAWFASIVGRSEEALRAANRAIAIEPQTPSCWFALGWAAWSSHDWDAAESALLRCRELEPGNALWHNNLGALYAKLGRLEEAMALFRSALSIDARSEYVYTNLAECLRRVDRWEEAADLALRHQLNRLHDADVRVERVGDCDAFVSRALVNHALLRLTAAVEDLRFAAELAVTPWDAGRTKQTQVFVAMAEGRMEDAVGAARDLIRDHSDEPEPLRVAAAVGWMTGEPSLSADAARLAEKQAVGVRTESNCRSNAALAEGRWGDAAKELEIYFSATLGDGCCPHAEAAYAAFKAGDLKSADSHLRTAADVNPNCDTLRVLDRLQLVPVRGRLPAHVQPWLLSEEPLA